MINLTWLICVFPRWHKSMLSECIVTNAETMSGISSTYWMMSPQQMIWVPNYGHQFLVHHLIVKYLSMQPTICFCKSQLINGDNNCRYTIKQKVPYLHFKKLHRIFLKLQQVCSIFANGLFPIYILLM